MAIAGWSFGGGGTAANATGINNQSFAGVEAVPRDTQSKPGVTAPATPFPFDPVPMDDARFAAAVKAAQDDASLYIDGYIAPYRSQATRFYRGDPFGNEEEGRSQIVMTDVRDTTLAMLPGLLRVFTSSDEAVSFDPNTADKVEMAEQEPTSSTLCSSATTPASTSSMTASRTPWSARPASSSITGTRASRSPSSTSPP